jgi:hypothetical protein
MTVTALAISAFALAISVIVAVAAWRQIGLARHANALPVLIDLFHEHRGEELADARHVVYQLKSRTLDVSKGFDGIPEEKGRKLAKKLAWFYDNVGALVTYGTIDIEPVSGYMGGAVLDCWYVLAPFIAVERAKRASASDPASYQQHFENLVALIEETQPHWARVSQPNWLLD